MSATIVSPVGISSVPEPNPVTTDINTVATIAEGVALATPVGAIAAPAIGAASAIADLIVKMSDMYSRKIITSAQLNAMVSTAVSGYDASVKAWQAAP